MPPTEAAEPAEPASEGALLPPTGMLVSTAIISARMSSTGYVGERGDSGGQGGGHAYLGHCLVVDVDKLSGVRVDLESAVEAESGLDGVCACATVSEATKNTRHFVIQRSRTRLYHALSLRDLLHEVCLNLLRVLGEALLVRTLDRFPDGLLLLLSVGLGLLLHGAGLALRFLLQLLAELGIGPSLVVEVKGIGGEAGDDSAHADGGDGRGL